MTFNQLVRRAAITAVVAFATSHAFAADTGSLTVTATVSGICKLAAVPAMGFTLDPSSTLNGTATSAVTYRCTKGTAPTEFKVGGQLATPGYASGATAALGALKGTGANTDVLPYRIDWTAPSVAGSGLGSGVTPVTVTLTGSILNADFINVTADTYTANVAVTISP
jgi:spore coat protein U-like protein